MIGDIGRMGATEISRSYWAREGSRRHSNVKSIKVYFSCIHRSRRSGRNHEAFEMLEGEAITTTL